MLLELGRDVESLPLGGEALPPLPETAGLPAEPVPPDPSPLPPPELTLELSGSCPPGPPRLPDVPPPQALEASVVPRDRRRLKRPRPRIGGQFGPVETVKGDEATDRAVRGGKTTRRGASMGAA